MVGNGKWNEEEEIARKVRSKEKYGGGEVGEGVGSRRGEGQYERGCEVEECRGSRREDRKYERRGTVGEGV